MKADIVIGSLFGDCGKGITTDYLCKKNPEKTIVVRFSGGHQAGHNVKIGDISHVHSNYGSGALRGVPSYYSEHCTMYPVTLYNEREILISKTGGIDPELYYHPLVKITTPADVAYNRLTEQKLGHGSCGLGIAATMKRNNISGYKLFGIDLLHPEILEQKLVEIYWYYRGLIQDKDIAVFNSLFEKENIQFQNAIYTKELQFHIKPYSFLEYYNNLVFEGSQGILLDMTHGIFPNVTYANTTSKNALEICKILNISNIEIYYVTRCYQTRHGAGWMSNRNPITLINTKDEINKFNDWQKEFKIGEIDYTLLNQAYRIDNIYSEGISKNLVVTCLDQRPGFKFDYDKLSLKFNTIYNSYSADSSSFE